MQVPIDWLNPLPKDKFLDKTKLKAIAGENLDISQMIEFVLERIENIVWKRRKCIFSFSHNNFKRLLPWGHLKSGLCGKELRRGNVSE